MKTGFNYAQVRIQSRHGDRPAESTWQLLTGSRDLSHYLHVARNSELGRWTQKLSATATAHVLDRSLRQDWRDHVHRVANWLPAAWRAPVSWLGTLVYLPSVLHLLRQLPVRRWMRDDPVLGSVALDDPAARWEALENSEFGPLARDYSERGELLSLWIRHCRVLLPSMDKVDERGMGKLEGFLTDHVAAMQSQSDADRLRGALEQKLVTLFRRQAGRPAAVFCHLGLTALDLEKLRRGLMRRSLFGELDRVKP